MSVRPCLLPKHQVGSFGKRAQVQTSHLLKQCFTQSLGITHIYKNSISVWWSPATANTRDSSLQLSLATLPCSQLNSTLLLSPHCTVMSSPSLRNTSFLLLATTITSTASPRPSATLTSVPMISQYCSKLTLTSIFSPRSFTRQLIRLMGQSIQQMVETQPLSSTEEMRLSEVTWNRQMLLRQEQKHKSSSSRQVRLRTGSDSLCLQIWKCLSDRKLLLWKTAVVKFSNRCRCFSQVGSFIMQEQLMPPMMAVVFMKAIENTSIFLVLPFPKRMGFLCGCNWYRCRYLYSTITTLSGPIAYMAWHCVSGRVRKFSRGRYRWKNSTAESVEKMTHYPSRLMFLMGVSGGSWISCVGSKVNSGRCSVIIQQ